MSATDLPHAEFGFPGALPDRLVTAILSGEKISTTGLHEFVCEGAATDAVGDRELVVDSAGRGVAVIDDGSRGEADSEVDVAFAIDDGKGFEMLEAWREALVGFCTRT